MSPRITLATTRRVLVQLRADHRTVALLLFVPALLITLLRYLFDDQPALFDRLGGPMLGLFPFIIMFLITSITMLRERTSGTLERLMTTPMAKLDLLLGYGLAFAIVAGVQAAVSAGVAFGLLGLDVAGSPWLVCALAVGNAVLGTAFGLFVSAFASTEFQAVQFMPAVVLPQLLLCGLFAPRDGMVGLLEAVSAGLPLTYAFQALQDVAVGGKGGADVLLGAAVIAGSTLLLLALGATTLRRRTA